MDNQRRGKKNPPASDPTGATSIMERRRIGRVVHDERGNARLEWVNARPDEERVALSLEDQGPASRPEQGYDPYRKEAGARLGSDPPGRPVKRDLRKLSDWIKQMRELEARKQNADERDEE